MESLSPYSNSPGRVVRRMLKMADPKYGELLLDVGSGLGDMVIESAKRYPHIRCVGIEIDRRLAEISRERIRKKGLEGRIDVVEGNFLKYGLEGVDIVTAYLTPRGMAAIEGKVFSELSRKSRFVSHDYEFRMHAPNESHYMLAKSAFDNPSILPVPHWVGIYWMDDVQPKKSRFPQLGLLLPGGLIQPQAAALVGELCRKTK